MERQLRIALYPGSFDGLTYGHLDLIQRGSKLFDRLIVGVANNSRKSAWFSPQQRVELVQECTRNLPNISAVVLKGLTVDVASQLGAQFIVRGLRAVSDFEFEFQMAIMNHRLNPSVETIFLAPATEFVFLSSSMVKEVWSLGGDVSPFVPAPILRAFEQRRDLKPEVAD